MTKKETSKAVTRLTKKIRELVDVSTSKRPLASATVFIHHISEDKMPPGFEHDHDWGSYRTYEYKDPEGAFSIKAFTDH